MAPIPLTTFVKVLYYLLSEGAIIYGETVRDMLVQKKDEKIYRKKNYPDSMFYHSKYMPHLGNRFKHPSVIEFCLPDGCDAEKVHENISKIFECRDSRKWMHYSGDYYCTYTDKYSAIFDFVQTSQLSSDIDFDCNGLMLKNVSEFDIEVELIPGLEKNLEEIVDNIGYTPTNE